MSRDDFAQQVRDAIDIVDVVSDQTPLQRRGKRLLGLCPFHKEKTPSFSVDPEQGLFYCFGCGAGGDALGFHMRITGDDFRTTLEAMARRYGVAIPQQAGRRQGPDFDGVLAAAADFFRERLASTPLARRYLEERRIDPELVETFGVGFAPDAWQNLHDALGSRFPTDLLEKAGLVARSEKGRVYDRFRNRLMFPIRSTTGRIVGFGGRTLGDDRAKYINTAETEAFSKGRILYGLDIARPRIREEGKVLLVEGYFDVLGAVASGIDWTVASMGTALTEGQAKLMQRYADEIVLGYDGDRAGEEAARKAMTLLLPGGSVVRRARFPAGQDPDSLRLEEGVEAVRQVVLEAPDAVLLEIERVPLSVRDDPRRSAAAAEHLATVLRAVSNEVLRQDYAKRAAGRLLVEEDLLLRAPPPERGRAEADRRDGPGSDDRGARRGRGSSRPSRRETVPEEHRLMRLLLAGARPDVLPPPELFWDEDYRSLYRAWTAAVLDEEFDGDLVAAVRELAPERGLELLARLRVGDGRAGADDDEGIDVGDGQDDVVTDEELGELDGVLARLERRHLDRQRRVTLAEMKEAEACGDTALYERLLTRYAELRQQRFRRSR